MEDKCCQISLHPVIKEIARTLLVILISTISLESIFSIGGYILDLFRSSLSSTTMKILIYIQNQIKAKTIEISEMVKELTCIFFPSFSGKIKKGISFHLFALLSTHIRHPLHPPRIQHVQLRNLFTKSHVVKFAHTNEFQNTTLNQSPSQTAQKRKDVELAHPIPEASISSGGTYIYVACQMSTVPICNNKCACINNPLLRRQYQLE